MNHRETSALLKFRSELSMKEAACSTTENYLQFPTEQREKEKWLREIATNDGRGGDKKQRGESLESPAK